MNEMVVDVVVMNNFPYEALACFSTEDNKIELRAEHLPGSRHILIFISENHNNLSNKHCQIPVSDIHKYT